MVKGFRTIAGRSRRVNAGGWPYRAKTVFDATSKRKADKACNTLHDAIMHIHGTVTGYLWDAVAQSGDRASLDALDILNTAMQQVGQADADAQQLAKSQESN